MAKYSVVVQKKAQKHLQTHYKSGDKGSIKRINQIFEELSEHPETGIGQPEEPVGLIIRHKFSIFSYEKVSRGKSRTGYVNAL